MYWEALGLPGAAISSDVEDLAQWIQWAMQELMDGASTETVEWEYGVPISHSNEELIRYNLNQFWIRKDPILGAANADNVKNQIYRLDMLAHGILNALDDGKMYSTASGYWSFYWSLLTGTPVTRDVEKYHVEAKAAAADAARAATQAGLPTLATYFSNETKTVDAIAKDAAKFWNQPGLINDIPMWAWVAAGLGALLLLDHR